MASRRSPTAPPVQGVRGRYDAAQTTVENQAHWANADGLSAAAANDPETRRVLRNRSRYERDNNSYASGMAETLSNDVIGTGPRLQMLTDDDAANRRCADAFEEWTAVSGLAETLRTFRESRTIDGEGFGIFTTNSNLPTPVKLELKLYEADQVATPDLWMPSRRAIDGIVFDAGGHPVEYHVLRDHPGDMTGFGGFPGQYERVPASEVVHWFKRRRPGQARGIPEITPAIPLYALLRRYTLAVITAAETAALFAALIKSTLPPEDDGDGILPFQTEQLTRGLAMFLPDGYDAMQLKPEQPTSTYKDFKSEILNEIARCLNVPYNVAAGNSSGYNYASGRLDHQVYHRMIGVDRYYLETAVLDRLLLQWFREARIADPGSVEGLGLPGWPNPITRLPRRQWFWDGFKHVDPIKEANAQERRLRNGVTSLRRECAEEGIDYREVADELAEERAYYARLGIPYPGDATGAVDPRTSEESVDDETA